jgi:hypothetical protein
MSKSCRSAANVNAFQCGVTLANETMLEWFLQMITGPSQIFSHQEKFARITPINYGNRLCFRINRIKKENINIKSEEPLKNLKNQQRFLS